MSPSTSRRTRITTAVVGVGVAAVLAVSAFSAARGGAAPGDDPTAAPTGTPTPSATVAAPITSAAPIRTDLTAEVTSMRAITARTAQPGEIGGPAVRFAIRVHNTTGAPISLADTVVNATAGADHEPAYAIDSAGTPLPATVPAGATVTGVYVFTIPEGDRGTVTVTLDTSTADPVVAFTGAAPR